ncbi:PI-PLC X domain-containing protein 1-like [Denticeps clupeoides]|uniref:Phosphatidylinositol-specific phospholipase C X domain-containing protein n=1 Tax=Denticeps clupeoides TaxID=299321 RepID=A0AAY4C310_9TELE|nr:PI-PLC X domain-containing protein 1-like [Denticeps clupeoides]
MKSNAGIYLATLFILNGFPVLVVVVCKLVFVAGWEFVPGPCRSLPVPAGPCRSLPVPAGPCRSLPVPAGPCRSLPVPAGPCHTSSGHGRLQMRSSRGRSVEKDWMAQLPEKLWRVPLWDLAIPGSHDTMSYCLDSGSPVLQSEGWLLRSLDRCVPCILRPCVKKWATTQAWSISDQLDDGIRFLDLRVAHKTCDISRKLYFAHGIYTQETVKEALTLVAQWLKQHPREVVIIACSAFDGMGPAEHLQLILFLTSLFEKKLCPKKEVPSLQLCWDLGCQVILSYDDSAAQSHQDLWPKIDYWWANEAEPDSVVSYLDRRKVEDGRPSGSFFVAGINLTEDMCYVLHHPLQSMKSMTLSAYAVLLDWVRKQRPGPQKTCLNIICADFVGVNEFISEVIELNRQLITTAPSSPPDSSCGCTDH